eukprot:11850522-Heterocapsa_arctica.AAC.1
MPEARKPATMARKRQSPARSASWPGIGVHRMSGESGWRGGPGRHPHTWEGKQGRTQQGVQ